MQWHFNYANGQRVWGGHQICHKLGILFDDPYIRIRPPILLTDCFTGHIRDRAALSCCTTRIKRPVSVCVSCACPLFFQEPRINWPPSSSSSNCSPCNAQIRAHLRTSNAPSYAYEEAMKLIFNFDRFVLIELRIPLLAPNGKKRGWEKKGRQMFAGETDSSWSGRGLNDRGGKA